MKNINLGLAFLVVVLALYAVTPQQPLVVERTVYPVAQLALLVREPVASYDDPLQVYPIGPRDPILHIFYSGKEDPTREDLVALYKRFTAFTEKLPTRPEGLLSDLETWEEEILPYFQYEGIVDNVRQPTRRRFAIYHTGRNHNHLGGRALCADVSYELNARYAREISPWSERWGALGVLVHELAHVQGICAGTTSEYEVAAELASTEVTAAMANHGSRYMAYATLVSLTSQVQGALYYKALNERRMPQFIALVKMQVADPYRQAAFDKSVRYWESNPYLLRTLLYDYYYRPTSLWLQAVTGDAVIHGLRLPDGKRELKVDDLQYFIKNLESLMR